MNIYDYYKYYDIRVKLDDGTRSISMMFNPGYSPKDYVVILSDPEKLKVFINEHNKGRTPEYLTTKAQNAWGGVRRARIDQREADSLPAPSMFFDSLPMGVIGFWRHRGRTGVRFTDGVTRSSELIRQKAEFVPVQTRVEVAEIGYQLIGRGIPPIPATAFLVPDEKRNDLFQKCLPDSLPSMNRSKAIRRLQKWVFRHNQITNFKL